MTSHTRFITIDGLPPSDNNVYVQRRDGRGRASTTKLKVWTKAVWTAYLEQVPLRERSRLRNADAIEVHIRLFLDLRTKAGTMRKWDTSSHQKVTIDAITKAIGLDDCHVVRQVIEKRQRRVADGPQTHIGLAVLSEG